MESHVRKGGAFQSRFDFTLLLDDRLACLSIDRDSARWYTPTGAYSRSTDVRCVLLTGCNLLLLLL